MTRTPAEKEAKLRLFYRRQIEDLHRRGTLFAWHLFLDAVKVFPRSGVGLVPKLGAPAPYTESESEIRALAELGATAIDECRKSTPSVVFELGILYLVSRDVAMAASQLALGRFTFSRFAPFEYRHVAYPLTRAEYQYAMGCRRCSTRGGSLSRDSLAERALLGKAADLLQWWGTILSEVRACTAS